MCNPPDLSSVVECSRDEMETALGAFGNNVNTFGPTESTAVKEPGEGRARVSVPLHYTPHGDKQGVYQLGIHP